MKKIFCLLLAAAAMGSAMAQNGFTVKANIREADGYKLFLAYSENGKLVLDTNYVREGDLYVFKGQVTEPLMARLGVRNHPALIARTERGIVPGPSLSFFLSNDQIEIEGEAATIYASRIQGGKANAEWQPMLKDEARFSHEGWLLTKMILESQELRADSNQMKEVVSKRRKLNEDIQAKRKKFMLENPNSLASVHYLTMSQTMMPYDELKKAYEALGPDARKHSSAIKIAERVKSLEATAVGKTAVAIQKKDINGQPVNLETLRGKYVLLDFWGSWCGPCRQGHPHLKEIYSKYKDKGFEIVGIAQENKQTLEDSRKVWKEAIDKDGLPWIQVLNNEGVETFDAVKAYGVNAFPTKVLLDKQGNVIARFVGEGGNAFDLKMQELFGF